VFKARKAARQAKKLRRAPTTITTTVSFASGLLLTLKPAAVILLA